MVEFEQHHQTNYCQHNGIAHKALHAQRVGGDKLAALAGVGFHRHQYGLRRDGHVEVELQEHHDAHQRDVERIEQPLDPLLASEVNDERGKIRHGNVHQESLGEELDLIPKRVVVAEPLDVGLRQQRNGHKKEHRLFHHRSCNGDSHLAYCLEKTFHFRSMMFKIAAKLLKILLSPTL